MKSLESLIKQKIVSRIVFCMMLTTCMVIWFSIESFNTRLKIFTTEIDNNCKLLEDYVISQVLVPNYEAIQYKMEDFNKGNTYQIRWINKNVMPAIGFQIHWDTSWNYFYPIRTIDHNRFGYFIISGSMIKEHQLYVDIWPYIIILSIFSSAMAVLLLPLGKSIPKQLFVDPIHNILSILKKDSATSNLYNSKEIYEIEQKIIELLTITNKKSKDEAVGRLAEHIAHDIQSPLLTLNSILFSNTPTIIDDNRAILKRITYRINDLMNELLIKYPSNNANILKLCNDTNARQHVLLFMLINEVMIQKNIEWAAYPCDFKMLDETDGSIWVFINYSRFYRVISNLLNNAYEALKNINRQISITITNQFNNVFISIHDTGIGIQQDQIDNVLNGKSLKHVGHGIGLPSAISYFESLGGKLELISQHGIGTTIMVSIPQSPIPQWFSNSIKYNYKSEFVILDDNASTIMMWQQRFIKLNIKASYFLTVTDLLQWISLNMVHNDMILLSDFDLNDDNYTGVDIIKMLSFKRSYLITSYADEAYVQELAGTFNFYLIPKALVETMKFELELG